jgi:hypothetical protein
MSRSLPKPKPTHQFRQTFHPRRDTDFLIAEDGTPIPLVSTGRAAHGEFWEEAQLTEGVYWLLRRTRGKPAYLWLIDLSFERGKSVIGTVTFKFKGRDQNEVLAKCVEFSDVPATLLRILQVAA